MNSERLKQIEEIYHAALEIEPAGREVFLQDRCVDDNELRREVESLLSYEETSNFMGDSQIQQLAAEVFVPNEKQADLTGKKISHYRIEKLLGAGGMGEVYLAEDTKLKRQVAVKVLLPEVAGDADRVRRFAREAQAVIALNHPNILTIHEFGVENGVHFIVTEFVRGMSLREKLSRGGLTLDGALEIAAQVASALAEAHEAGIIHRDIKPENIMIRTDGYVKVLDFGVAKLVADERPLVGDEDPTRELFRTKRGSMIGTAPYMSPEQARGKKIDARTDIWSLGVVLYEMLAGRLPFSGETGLDAIALILSTEPPQISSYGANIPAELDWIVAKALAKDVEARYQTAKELRADLEKIRKRIELDISISRAAHTELGGGNGLTEEDQIHSTVASSIKSVIQHAQTNRLRYLVIMPILLAAMFFAGYFVYVSMKDTRRIDSIAVLPFENITGDANLNYLSDGLSNALIDRFAQLPQLKVISRNSSFKFRGSDIDVKDAASQLGARAVVTGSVQQSGDDIIVRVDVMDATEDRQLGGAQYRRKATELETLRNEIAKDTAEQLKIILTDAQTKRLVERSTENSEAYRYYLNGLVTLDGTPAGYDRALPFFEKAIGLDPEFALAHAESAWVYYLKALSNDDPRTVMPKVKAAVETALALDSELAKAHVMRALVYEYELNWQEAEREYLHAIDLSPNLDFARNNYAWFLSLLDRQDKALEQFEEQRIRDPLSMRLLLLNKAWVLVQARRFDDALQTYREAQAVEPSKKIPDFALGYAYAGKGLYNEAISYYKLAVVDLGGEEKYSQPLVYLVVEYAKIPEKRSEARAILKKIEAMEEYKSPALLAAVYAALDDNDKAMELLEKAYLDRDLLLRFIGVAYEYDGLRNDPRFKDLLKRTNLRQ